MICAIDPSTKKLAFAVGNPAAKAGGLLWGEIPTGNGASDLALFQQWIAGLKAMGVTHVAYEVPYMGKNVASFQRLAEVRALVEASAKAAGLVFIAVNASQWQAACLTVGRGSGAQKREIVKPLAMRYATDVLGVPPGSQDIADAVCIHRFTGLVLWHQLKGGAA